MRKTLVFSSIFFVLALIFAPLTSAVTIGVQKIDPELQIYVPTNTPTPTPTPNLKILPAKDLKIMPIITGTATNTPIPTIMPTSTATSEITPEITGIVAGEQEETTVVGEVTETKEEPKNLDQREIIGVILIGLLIVIIIIQALWDKFRKPSSSNASDPE